MPYCSEHEYEARTPQCDIGAEPHDWPNHGQDWAPGQLNYTGSAPPGWDANAQVWAADVATMDRVW